MGTLVNEFRGDVLQAYGQEEEDRSLHELSYIIFEFNMPYLGHLELSMCRMWIFHPGCLTCDTNCTSTNILIFQAIDTLGVRNLQECTHKYYDDVRSGYFSKFYWLNSIEH